MHSSSSPSEKHRRNKHSISRSLEPSPYFSGPIRDESYSSPSRRSHFSYRPKSPYAVPLQLYESSPPSKKKTKLDTPKSPIFSGEHSSQTQAQSHHQYHHSPYSVASTSQQRDLGMSPYNSKKDYMSDGISCSGSTTHSLRMNHTQRRPSYSQVIRSIMLPFEVEEQFNLVFGNETLESEESHGPRENKNIDPIANMEFLEQNKYCELANEQGNENSSIDSDFASSIDDEKVFASYYKIEDIHERQYLTRHFKALKQYSSFTNEEENCEQNSDKAGLESNSLKVKLPPVEKKICQNYPSAKKAEKSSKKKKKKKKMTA